jgi:sensor histidine kinase YesM
MIIVVVVFFFISLNETINEIIRTNQQLQSDVKDAEIAFLRSQINPHFLYNALNSIAALCIDEPHKAEELTLDLSRYLRGSFDFKQLESLTTIENELELVEAYINIEKARFGARLCVEYEVDGNLDNIRIPSLILQPLVENAIRHGLMSNLRGGTVKISVKEKVDGVVSFAVEDNGCGMSEERRKDILKPDVKKGVGLWNISQRIKLLYGKGIHIESEEGIGTKVFFDIPA